MTTKILPLAGFLLAPLAIAACDAQTDTGYAGQALLTLNGSVSGANVEGDVVPALVFGDLFADAATVVDVDVTGEFPSSFSVRVFDAPSEQVLGAGLQIPGESRGVFGYIVAVDADHPDTLPKNQRNTVEGGTCTDDGCEFHKTVTDPDGNEIYSETRVCDSNEENCTVTSKGDPSALEDSAKWFRGVVQNYGVVYFEDPVSSRSIAGSVYGELEAGYHLVQMSEFSASESEEMARCSGQADEQGIAAYNQEHGTNYQTVADVSENDEYPVALARQKAFFDLGCRLDSGVKMTVLAESDAQELALELTSDYESLDLPFLF